MIPLLSLWAHALAASLYAGLAVWQLRQAGPSEPRRPLTAAFAVIALWAVFVALFGPLHSVAQLAEAARNIACLAFLYTLIDRDEGEDQSRPLKGVFAAVAAAIALQIVMAGLLPRFSTEPVVVETLLSTAQMIGLTVAAGSLILVHNVYGQAARPDRSALRLPLAALALMWAYDLHLFTAAYVSRSQPLELYALRGAVAAGLVPLFAMGLRRSMPHKVQLSRAATFQSLSLLAILAYLLVTMSAGRALELTGADWMAAAEIALLATMSIAAIILIASAKARSWAQVMVQKHLFQHRYDYRQEWLRFTATLGAPAGTAATLEQRVIKALADIAGAPGGMLLRRDEDRLAAAAVWNWPAAPADAGSSAGSLITLIETTGHVVDFTTEQPSLIRASGLEARLPDWLASAHGAWAGVPLVHGGRLVGLVIITHPPVSRPLDWEDFDLFRTAGRQAASHLAEAQTLATLAEARRFDDFNRRFAFILHDIKNLVSQLSLVARNAERHADNPEFRADMIATLQSSVRKMNDLLARLAPGAGTGAEVLEPQPVTLQPLLARLVESRSRTHALRLEGDARAVALADPGALEKALVHLVQNAIEASRPEVPVELSYTAAGGQVAIAVRDRGCGMSAEFVQTRLFQPFVSTKEGGFGVGAHEARTMIEKMGGRIEVESAPGNGTRFTIRLPAAATDAPTTEQNAARISA